MNSNFLPHFVNIWAYGITCIFLIIAGFKIFDWCTPRIHFVTELVDHQNIAVGIVVAAIILSMAAIAVAIVLS